MPELLVSTAEILANLPKPKQMKLDVNNLVVDPNIQIRFQPGESTFGFRTEFGDSSDTAQLESDIFVAGRILVPLVISRETLEGADGKPVHKDTVVRGNGRTKCGQRIKARKDCPRDLFDALTKTECTVYEGLTKEQILALVDDQSSTKTYTAVDVVNVLWKEAFNGTDWKRICLAHAKLIAESYLNTTAAREKLAGLYRCSTPAEQLDYINTWMSGSIRQSVILASTLGARVRKAFLLQTAKDNNLIEKVKQADGTFKYGEMPEFNAKSKELTTKGSKQNRLLTLSKIKEECISAKTPWDVPDSVFHAKIEEYILEDKGETVKNSIDRPTVIASRNMSSQARATVSKAYCNRFAGDAIDNLQVLDAEAFRLESFRDYFVKVLNNPGINSPDVAAVVAAFVKCSDVEQLSKMMEPFLTPKTTVETASAPAEVAKA